MTKLFSIWALGVCLFFSQSIAFAFDLDQARSQKQVVEMPDGYLKALDSSVSSDVKTINAKRKEAYEQLARKEGVDLKVITERAGKKLVEKNPSR